MSSEHRAVPAGHTALPAGATPATADPTDTAGLKRQVERTRAELADTVEGLMYHLDVKSRATEKVQEATAKARATGERLRDRAVKIWHDKPQVVVGAGAGVVTLGIVVVAVRVSAGRKGSK